MLCDWVSNYLKLSKYPTKCILYLNFLVIFESWPMRSLVVTMKKVSFLCGSLLNFIVCHAIEYYTIVEHFGIPVQGCHCACAAIWGKSFCVSSRGSYKSDFYLKLAPVQVCYIKTCGETTTIKNFPTLTQYRIISLNCFLSVGVHDRNFSDNCIKFLFSFPAPKL